MKSAKLIPAHLQMPLPALPQPAGRIRFEGLYPDRYIILPAGTADLYVASVLLGTREVLGGEFELDSGAPPLRIIYKPHPGAFAEPWTEAIGPGSSSCRAVKRSGTRCSQRKFRCDGNGRFEATGLRPGDYYAFAFLKREDQAAPEDPDCFRALATQGAKVEVREGEISSVDLSPGPGCMF